MKILRFYFLFLLSCGFFAEAGFIKGNGGNVYSCASQSSMELLDFTEMEHVMGWHLSVRHAKNQEADLVKTVIERARQLNPQASARWNSMYQTFWNEAVLMPTSVLAPIDDSKHEYVPAGCDVLQAVVRRARPLPGEARYLVSQFIWNKLPLADRVGLLFHEVIYRDCGGEDSRKVRALNALLFSDDFEKKSRQEVTNYFAQACF